MNNEQLMMPDIQFVEKRDLPVEYIALGSLDVDAIDSLINKYKKLSNMLVAIALILYILSVFTFIISNYLIALGLISIATGSIMIRRINELVILAMKSIEASLIIDEPPDLQIFIRNPEKMPFIKSAIKNLLSGEIESQTILLLPPKTLLLDITGDLLIFMGLILISYSLIFLSVYLFVILGSIVLYMFLDIMNNIFDIIRNS